METSKSPIVTIVAYRLNQNHYHFILTAVVENGIQKFMQRLSARYTKFFNEKYQRSDALFQGNCKRKIIETNEYLLHVSCYVNLNDLVHKGMNDPWLLDHCFSSFSQYTGEGAYGVKCDTSIILEQYTHHNLYKVRSFERLADIIERREKEKQLVDILLD